MDILGDLLRTLSFHGVVYFTTRFSQDWGVTVPDLGRAIRFHCVLDGVCHVRFGDGQHVELRRGDVMLIAHGSTHSLASTREAPAYELEHVLADAGYDGEGVFSLGETGSGGDTRLLCGHFDFRAMARHPIIDSLPDHLVVRAAERAEAFWLDSLLKMMAERADPDAADFRATVTRLSEVLFLELLRSGWDEGRYPAGFLQALDDPRMAAAIAAMHDRPDERWTIDSLAAIAGMSRSNFAARFREQVGLTPIDYLTEWRMQIALAALQDRDISIKQLAREAGYDSAAAFSRAFAKAFGQSPRAIRGDKGVILPIVRKILP